MYKNTINLLIVLTITLLVSSCTKEVPKEFFDKQNSQNRQQNRQEQQENPHQQMPDDSIHRNLSQNQNNSGDDKSDTKGDPKAEQMTKAADDAETQYQKTKSAADKMVCINKQLTAANYLMFEANLSPKKKYRSALQRYRRVLELDPDNSEAMENKKQIEDIYQSMGMPVPN